MRPSPTTPTRVTTRESNHLTAFTFWDIALAAAPGLGRSNRGNVGKGWLMARAAAGERQVGGPDPALPLALGR